MSTKVIRDPAWWERCFDGHLPTNERFSDVAAAIADTDFPLVAAIADDASYVWLHCFIFGVKQVPLSCPLSWESVERLYLEMKKRRESGESDTRHPERERRSRGRERMPDHILMDLLRSYVRVQNSEGKYPTVRECAKRYRTTHKRILRIAEDFDGFTVNVAVQCGSGVYEHKYIGDFELECD